MKKIKVYFKNQIKRFSVSNRTSYSDLIKILENLFIDLKVEHQELLYKDQDNEWVSFNTQLEWNEAIELTDTLLIVIPTHEPQINQNITCDGCKKENFKGTRYKCKICSDFDYCSSCYIKNNAHSTHPFIEIFRSRRIIPVCKGKSEKKESVEKKEEKDDQSEENEEFSLQLKVLKGMGFDNTEKNLQLLKKHNGNLQKSVDEQLNH